MAIYKLYQVDILRPQGVNMKETMLDALMYLFDQCAELYDDPREDQARIAHELRSAGFAEQDIDKALAWMERLYYLTNEGKRDFDSLPDSIRCYSEEEAFHIDTEARGFLLFLEQSGVIDCVKRETIID